MWKKVDMLHIVIKLKKIGVVWQTAILDILFLRILSSWNSAWKCDGEAKIMFSHEIRSHDPKKYWGYQS